MPEVRYPQFCAVARAAEILGERWNLLILKHLFVSPRRFSDLKRLLLGISSSVLTERLTSLEAAGVLERREIEAPVPGTLYQLTAMGQAFSPAFVELAKWGSLFLLPVREDEAADLPSIVWFMQNSPGVAATQAVSAEFRANDTDCCSIIHVEADPERTVVSSESAPADVVVLADGLTLVGLIAGAVDPQEALTAGLLEIEGDASLLTHIPPLFSLGLPLPDENVTDLESEGV